MSRREKIIAVILISVVGIWAKGYLSKPNQKPMNRPITLGSAVPKGGITLNPSAGELTVDEVLLRERIKKGDSPLAAGDPFQKFNPRRKAQKRVLEFSDLTLSGIMWEHAEPAVLINDEILKEGEIIGGFKIENIQESEVVVSRGTEKYTLRLLSQTKGK